MARKKGNVGQLYVNEQGKEILDGILEPIRKEMYAALNDIAGTFGVATMGLKLARKDLLKTAKEAPDPEAHLIFGTGDGDDRNSIGYLRWRIDSLENRLAMDGLVAQQLGQQWLVLIHSVWEHEYRPRLAAAAGVDVNTVAVPLLADVGRMRHDVVHHHGVATAKNTGRCEVLEWFKPGDRILITGEHVAEFMARIGLVTLPMKRPVKTT